MNYKVDWDDELLLEAVADYLGERGCPMPDENPTQLSVMCQIGRQYASVCYHNGWTPNVKQVGDKVAADHLRQVQEEENKKKCIVTGCKPYKSLQKIVF